MELIATNSMQLPSGGKSPPEWVHLLPTGTFSGADGRGPYRVGDASALIEASMQAQRLTLDENHSTDFAMTSGVPSPARGWIVAMQSRADGLWGQVEWTEDGAAMVRKKEYRGISPVYEHTPDGQVHRVLRAALTNAPNLTLTALHSQGHKMDLNTLRTALGLPATADEAAVMAALTGLRGQIAAHATELGRVATAAGVAPDAKPEAIITALQARAAGATTEVQTLSGLVTTLQSQLTTLTNDRARDRAVLAIDAAAAAGKVIQPAMREHYIARHMADPAAVQKELDAMPSLHAGGFVPPASPTGQQVTGVEAQVAALMSVAPKKLAATRDARLGVAQGAA